MIEILQISFIAYVNILTVFLHRFTKVTFDKSIANYKTNLNVDKLLAIVYNYTVEYIDSNKGIYTTIKNMNVIINYSNPITRHDFVHVSKGKRVYSFIYR